MINRPDTNAQRLKRHKRECAARFPARPSVPA